jgi:hypothetical protein
MGGNAVTDFDAIRAVLAVFPPADGWTCTKVAWRQAIRIEHPEFGMRVCRVSDGIVVSVIDAGEQHAPPGLPHRVPRTRRPESAEPVH